MNSTVIFGRWAGMGDVNTQNRCAACPVLEIAISS